MELVSRRSLECIETQWLYRLDSVEAPPIPPGFKRESVRVHPAEDGKDDMMLVTTLDILKFVETPISRQVTEGREAS